jgi:hypothetical protein
VNGLTCPKACPSTPLRDRLWNTNKESEDTKHGVNGLTCTKACPSAPLLRDRLWNTDKDGEDINHDVKWPDLCQSLPFGSAQGPAMAYRHGW